MQLRFPKIQPLSSILPVQSGDEIRIECHIPTGLQPQASWFDTEGALATIPMVVDAADSAESNQDEVTARTSNMQIVGNPGTELVIVAAVKSAVTPPSENDFRVLLGYMPWPELPQNVMVITSPDHIEVRTREETASPRAVVPSKADQTDKVVKRLEQLRRQLSALEMPYFAAVAFPHVAGF